MEIKIQKLDRSKWKDYRDLRLEALKKEPTVFGSSYNEEKDRTEEEWKKRTGDVLFALSEDTPVGMVVYIYENKIKAKHIANIFGLYVSEKYRGMGIGKKLIDSVLEKIKENNAISKIKLTVNSEQKAALKLYESCGFKVVGKLGKELSVKGKLYDEFVMEKFID